MDKFYTIVNGIKMLQMLTVFFLVILQQFYNSIEHTIYYYSKTGRKAIIQSLLYNEHITVDIYL